MNIMSKFNLPSYLKGKSFSDASALIAKKFEGRTDRESVETLNELQGRLRDAQEFVKAEKEAQSQPKDNQGPQHQMPDGSMMPGASHQGDAAASAPRAEGAGMPMPEQAPSMSGAKELANSYFLGGDKDKEKKPGVKDVDVVKDLISGESGDAAGAAAGASGGGPGPAGYVAAATTALELGQKAFGPTGIDQSGATAAPDVPSVGGEAAMGAMKGAQAGMAFGPWGAAVGGVIGGAAGFVGGTKAKKEAGVASLNFDNNEHNQKTNSYKKGGYTNMYKFGSKLEDPLNTDALETSETPEISEEEKNKKLLEEDEASIAKSKPSYLEALRYSPVAMNAAQLANLKKPEKVGLDRLGNKYEEQLVDERGMQNTVQESVNNTRDSLVGASGGSGGRASANILASQLQGTKALSNAYQAAGAENRQEGRARQQFNLNVDKTNLGQGNQETNLNLQREAAYETNKSKLLSKIGDDLGGIGKEEMMKRYPELMGNSYGSRGEHLATLERIAAAKEAKKDKKKEGTETDVDVDVKNKTEEEISKVTEGKVDPSKDNSTTTPVNEIGKSSSGKPDMSMGAIKDVLSPVIKGEGSSSSNNQGSSAAQAEQDGMTNKKGITELAKLIPSQDGTTPVKTEEMKPSEIKKAVVKNTSEAISKTNSTESTVQEKAKAKEVIVAEIKDPVKAPEVIDTVIKEDESVSRNPLMLANKYLGIDENDVKQQDVIKGFLNGAVPGYMKNKGEVTRDQNAWCAAFVNSVLVEGDYEQLDYGKDNYNLIRAKQYEKYGSKVNGITEAQDGDLLVTFKDTYDKKTKKTRRSYHTGFYSGKKGEDHTMLGGNQSDRVSVGVISQDSIYAVRRIKGVEPLKRAERDRIQNTKYFDKKTGSTN
jgi:hypothetical protein